MASLARGEKSQEQTWENELYRARNNESLLHKRIRSVLKLNNKPQRLITSPATDGTSSRFYCSARKIGEHMKNINARPEVL
jgi:hypothetical protein